MDILQVCPYAFGEVGGISQHVQSICIRLARKHDVTVFVTDSRKDFPRSEIIENVVVRRFRRLAPSSSYYFSLDMLMALRKADFDVVHGHGYHSLPMHMSAVAKRKCLILTTHFHGSGHSSFRNALITLLKPVGRKTLDLADRIIAVSEFERELLLQQFRLDPRKIAVVPNGVVLDEFSRHQKMSCDRKKILYVGSLEEYKGVHYLVKVLPRISEEIDLEIVGKGPLRHALERIALNLKVDHRVKFYRDLGRNELLQKIFNADAVVLLSRHEAYSIIVAEALAAGTPCIVTNTSALSEWIDNKTCFGVSFPVDFPELAEKISRVVEVGIDRDSVKKWIGKKILDWDDVAKRLEKIYLNSYCLQGS